MFTFTDATALATIRNYGKRTDAQTLKMAAALAHYRKSHSLSETTDAQAPKSPVFTPLSRTRVNTLVKAFEACDADVTPEAFMASLKAASDTSRGAQPTAKAEPTEDTSPRGGTSERTVPQGNDSPVTIADVLAAISLAVDFAQVNPDARQAIADALFDASEALQPVVLIATPVAA